MLTKLTIFLSDKEREALQVISDLEMRGLREQARFIIHQDLVHRGLMTVQERIGAQPQQEAGRVV